MNIDDHIAQSNAEGSPEIIKVLMYHRVVVDEAISRSSWLCVSEFEFRRHLMLLEKWGYTPITFYDYKLFLEGELNLPKKPIILTFDDGYLDTFEVAFPLLKEFGMKAVIFVLGDRTIKTNSWETYDEYPPAPLMEPHHIIEMHAAGHEIGSHSMTHQRLTELSKEKLWDEISRSRMVLEILLNAPVHSFSYPYGLENHFTQKKVAEAGYSFGCSVYTGPGRFCAERYQIRRIEIRSGMGTTSFASRIRLPYQYFGWMKWKMKEMLSPKKQSGHESDFEYQDNTNSSIA